MANEANINDLKKNSTTTPAEKKAAPDNFPAMLVAFQGEIQRALPSHLSGDRMCRIALTNFRQTPLLAKCQPRSVFACVIMASQLGLEPGLNGRAYLIPYFNKTKGEYECQFVPGWKGLLELANRTGRSTCWTGAVFRGDDFAYELGDRPRVHHKPHGEDDPNLLQFVYAIGRVRDSQWPIVEVWSNERIKRHFKKYNKVGDKHYAHANWEMYARKIPLLQVLKYMPSSPELEMVVALSDRESAGKRQGITIDAAIGMDWLPSDSDDDGDDPPKDTGASTAQTTGAQTTAEGEAAARARMDAAGAPTGPAAEKENSAAGAQLTEALGVEPLKPLRRARRQAANLE